MVGSHPISRRQGEWEPFWARTSKKALREDKTLAELAQQFDVIALAQHFLRLGEPGTLGATATDLSSKSFLQSALVKASI